MTGVIIKTTPGRALEGWDRVIASAAVANLVEDGVTDTEIATRLGIGRKLVRILRREENLLPATGQGNREHALRLYAELAPWVEKLAAQGFGDRLIGKELGQSRHLIKRVRQHHGIASGGKMKKGEAGV